MTQTLTPDPLTLSLPLDGLTAAERAEVIQAARDGAEARIGIILGRDAQTRVLHVDTFRYADTLAELNRLAAGTKVSDSNGRTWHRAHGRWTGRDGTVPTEHMLARCKGVLYVHEEAAQ